MDRELETLVDRYGMAQVLLALANICIDKSGHVQINWQDTDLARTWAGLGARLAIVAVHARELP